MEMWFSLPRAKAGFPSPAKEWREVRLDIGKLLAPHRTSTFFGLCDGYSMQTRGVRHGDILVIDRSLPPQHHSVVIVATELGYTLKQFLNTPSGIMLASDHQLPLLLSMPETWEIWGVVTYAVTSLDPSIALSLPD